MLYYIIFRRIYVLLGFTSFDEAEAIWFLMHSDLDLQLDWWGVVSKEGIVFSPDTSRCNWIFKFELEESLRVKDNFWKPECLKILFWSLLHGFKEMCYFACSLSIRVNLIVYTWRWCYASYKVLLINFTPFVNKCLVL